MFKTKKAFKSVNKNMKTRKNQLKNRASQGIDSMKDMKSIISSLISKVTSESKKAITSDPMLHEFNIKKMF